MKRIFIISILLCATCALYAQTDSIKKREYVAYTVFYNVAPDNFNVPLIGFVNLSLGRQKAAHIGFVNTAIGDFTGAQIGFVNTGVSKIHGAQIGFINTAPKGIFGFQAGFVNTTGKTFGAQIGFVNTSLNGVLGAQIGFVNTSLKKVTGAQIGFVNTAAKGITGCQIGFVNYAEKIFSGVPVGFLSIVKNGGYHAVELSTNELYPYNISLKLGVPFFYTFAKLSYNNNLEKPFAVGFGAGSLVPVAKKLHFNPEMETSNSISRRMKNSAHTYSLAAGFRYGLTKWLSVSVAPALSLVDVSDTESSWYKPFYSLAKMNINDNLYFILGFRAGVSVNF